MKLFKRFAGKMGFVVCGALTGCTTYVEQPRPREVYVPPPPVYVQPAPVPVEAPVVSVGVVIRTEDDFYEPLSPYGRWEVVGGYGRCWIPTRVDRNWRPYCNGNWERTEAGWYWASDEPWAWATYHYGRWDLSPQFGWYWVPQTQWSPAWVSWHEGGGYVGWAPLQPSVRISAGVSVAVNVALIAPQAFVFVEPRRFLQPVRPTTVIVNNTTIVNKTVNITNVKIVNNTVINEGPRTQIIEQASGQRVRNVPVRDLRRKQEAAVVIHQKTTPSAAREKIQKNVPPAVRSEIPPREPKGQSDAQLRAKQAEAAAQEQLQRNARDAKRAAELESQRQAKEAAAKAQEEARIKANESRRAAELNAQQRAKAAQAEAQRKATEAAKLKPAPPRGKEPKQNARANVGAPIKQEQIIKRGGTNVVKKVQKKKGKDNQSPADKAAVVPPPSPENVPEKK